MKTECRIFFLCLTFFSGLIIVSMLLFSCGNPYKKHSGSIDTLKDDTVQVIPVSLLEKKLDSLGLVNVQKMDAGIAVEMKYSTTDNFMHFDMYGDFDKAYLQKDVAEKIVMAQKKLKENNKSYCLIIYDAARPRSIQQMMWDSLKMPLSEKYKYLAHPSIGSLHNYGCAVDLSITDEKGKAIDMGTEYDYSGDAAWPAKEELMLASGKLTQEQLENRRLLRKIMSAAGFTSIKTEWWHFDACSLAAAKKKYKIIE